MVATECAKTCGQCCTALVAELLGVQFHRQAETVCGPKNALGLRGCEADGVAEGIHGVDQAGGVLCGQPAAGGGDVVVGAAGEFRRHGVCGQRRGAHRQRQFAAQAPRHGQAACFIGFAQAVAGLDFDGGHALGHQRPRAGCRAVEQFFIAGRAGGGHGGADAAASARDVFVAGALQSLLELGSAVAAVHQVGVAVHQPRCHQGAAQVVFCCHRQAGGEIAVGAHPAQRVAKHQHGAIGHQAPVWAWSQGSQMRMAPK